MLTIDGSSGEGGGQILRSSLSLSMITGQPFKLIRIRGRRQKPGLLRQHLTALRAAGQISGAEIEGDHLGSGTIIFRPGRIVPGKYEFKIGSAGSTTLVFQTLYPALFREEGELIIHGGTHNGMAPPFDFLQEVFLPVLNRMGARFSAEIERYGFYPAGGGCLRFQIKPPGPLTPPVYLVPLEEPRFKVLAYSAHLPGRIIQEEKEYLENKLPGPLDPAEIRQVDSPGPGNVVMVRVSGPESTELFTAVGNRGRHNTMVCGELLEELGPYLESRVPVGEHLADQLLIPMVLAGSGAFLSVKPGMHTLTNMDVIKLFTGKEFKTREVAPGQWEISL